MIKILTRNITKFLNEFNDSDKDRIFVPFSVLFDIERFECDYENEVRLVEFLTNEIGLAVQFLD